MHGYLSLLLHAHLPFVRHPEHERFLEESWFYEAVFETYLPLIQLLQGWQQSGLPARLTLSLSPTLCSMLRDALLRERCARRLDALIQLAEAELNRTSRDPDLHALARFYREQPVFGADVHRAVCPGHQVQVEKTDGAAPGKKQNG